MARDNRGRTPLLWAAVCGKVGVARQLLELANRSIREAREEDGQGGLQPLHAASCVGAADICQLLVKDQANVRALLVARFSNTRSP